MPVACIETGFPRGGRCLVKPSIPRSQFRCTMSSRKVSATYFARGGLRGGRHAPAYSPALHERVNRHGAIVSADGAPGQATTAHAGSRLLRGGPDRGASSSRTPRAAGSGASRACGRVGSSPRRHLGANLDPFRLRRGGVRRRRGEQRPAHARRGGGAVTEPGRPCADSSPSRSTTVPVSPSTCPGGGPGAGRQRAPPGHRRRPRRAFLRPGGGRGLPRGGGGRRLCLGPVALRMAHARAGRGGPKLGLARERPYPLQGRGVSVDLQAVQLQQVWVEPDLRGRGYGKRGLADLCRLLLETTPAVCPSCAGERACDRPLRLGRDAAHDHVSLAHLRVTQRATNG